MARHNKIGHIGEESVADFLIRNGHELLDKNYRTRFGELDLVTKRDGLLHFIEVKSVRSIDTTDQMPEENVTRAKQQKMSKTIQFYMMEKGISDEDFVIDIAGVFIDPKTDAALIRILEAITFEY